MIVSVALVVIPADVSTETSSAHYPQSNGFAEANIKSIKKLGSFNSNQFVKSILIFRNAQRSVASSPAQMMLNRPIRDPLPANYCSFAPKWQQETDTLEKKERGEQKKPKWSITIEQPIHYSRSSVARQFLLLIAAF